jgi:Flp pilus assembly pilin Flp
MKEIVKNMLMKLKQEKGEVSVDWALVAVIMGLVITTVFSPGIKAALNAALTTIEGYLTAA